MPVIYQCSGRQRGVCDHEADRRWVGRCPICGRFYAIIVKGNEDKESKTSLANLSMQAEVKRISTGIAEFDRVIGGGLVPGAAIIISGPPGTGKTTLLLQICNHVASDGTKVIYASGEQTAEDIGTVARRIGIDNPSVEVLGLEGNIEHIVDHVDEKKAALVVIDSLQKCFDESVQGSVGSTSQGNAVTEQVVYFGKKEKVAFLIVSHVNKEGEIAGSLGVSHDVDTLLEFDPAWEYDEDGDMVEGTENLRHLTVGKNRNGPSGLTAMFEMTGKGVVAVRKKSKLFSV